MSLIARLRQSRRRRPATANARHRRLLQAQDPRLLLNRLFLSGVLVSEPQSHDGADGEPATFLVVAFPAPGTSITCDQVELTNCEVEVPTHVARRCHSDLRAGESIFLTGQLRGEGSVVATEIHSGSVAPPEEA